MWIQCVHPFVIHTDYLSGSGESRVLIPSDYCRANAETSIPFTLAFTPMSILMALISMSLGAGRKPEHPDESHVGTGKARTPHRKAPVR